MFGCALALSLSAQDINFTTDFETGDLRGWQQHGEAFRHQPTLGDNPSARGRGQPSNHQGRWWIGTFEKFQGRRGERPGTAQGDGPTGYLQSGEFTIPRGSLTFLVGGGAAFETRVELIALNQGGDVEFRENRVYYASGSNSETMHPVTWNLDRYAGARGFIRIVDNSSGGWGHINADAFRFVPRFQVAVPADRLPISPGVIEPVQPARVAAPDLMGRTLPQAREMAKEAGLQIERVETVQPGYTEGTVVRQVPEPGARMSRGGGIVLVLGPPPRVEVPGIVGMTVENASRTLERFRLRVGKVIEEETRRQRPGTVTDQDPQPGTEVQPGFAVTLVVAAAPRTVPMPDLRGRPLPEVEAILKELGLPLGRVDTVESTEPENRVVRQAPAPRTAVEPGTPVDVAVARKTWIEVPELIGRDLSEVAPILEELRLVPGEVNTVESSEPENRIVRQVPPPRTRVEPGTAVNVWVARRTRVEVPDLIGRHRSEVGGILEENRLALADVRERPSEQRPGTVLAQDPPTGSVVEAGTGVGVVVAVPMPPPPPVEEPPATGEPPMGGRPPPTGEPPGTEEPPPVLEPPVSGEPPVTEERAPAEQPPAVGEPPPVAPPEDRGGTGGTERRFDAVWIGAIVAALILGMVVTHLLHRRAQRRRGRRQGIGQTELIFRPRPDPGRATLTAGAPPGAEFELRLRPVRDPGVQRIEPGGDSLAAEDDES